MKSLLSALLIIVPTVVLGQENPKPSFGIKGGLNFSNISIEESEDNNIIQIYGTYKF